MGTRLSRNLFHLRYFLLLWLLIFCQRPLPGQDREVRHDSFALATIIGSDALKNVLALSEQWKDLPPSDQYIRLRDHVFPPHTRSLCVDFATTPDGWLKNTTALFATEFPIFSQSDRASIEDPTAAVALCVPVIALVDLAETFDRLPEIESLLDNVDAPRRKVEVEVLIVRSLLAIARREWEQANQSMFALSGLLESPQQLAPAIGSVLGLCWKSTVVDELRESSTALAFRCYELARGGGSPLAEVWKRHSFATHYRLQSLSAGDIAAVADPVSRSASRWRGVSMQTSRIVGDGYPSDQWRVTQGAAEKVACRDRDFLMYDVPLTGNFSVEALVSAFNYHETQLGFGGTWMGPAYDHKTLIRGHFAKGRSSMSLSPPLDEITDGMRVRLEIEDGNCTFSINGREVDQTRISASDPWLMIFSDWYTHGWIKNVRMLGDPQVPDSIDLLADQRMLGWYTFHEPNDQATQDWELLTKSAIDDDAIPGLVLHGKHRDIVRGSCQESLLQYHRPIFEDAILSYEFYYQPDAYCVFPALDQLAFVIDNRGQVAIHPITAGAHERQSRRPQPFGAMTASVPDAFAQGLRECQWNRMELHLHGTQLRLVLNGNAIHELRLSPTATRLFGLFHLSDQTQALVRNLVWKGGWPKQLEAMREHHLVDPSLEEIFSGINLHQSFHHDFASGIPLDRFAITGDRWKENLTQTERGIQLVRPGGNYVQTTISPNLQLLGDFDVVAQFEDFEATVEAGGDGNIQLMLGFSENAAEYRLYRKFSRFANKELGQQIIQAAYFHTREGHRSYEFPKMTSEAATGGKLRLIRRGDQLYYLFAAEESDYYRLLHRTTVPTGATSLNGFSLSLETTKPGRASVVWKSLDVRAQRLEGKALETPMTMKQLNTSRDALPRITKLDFGNANIDQRIQTWGTETEFDFSSLGLRVTAPGFKDWQGHGATPTMAIKGDFDLQLELEVEHLERPQAGGECVVYLEAAFQDTLRTAVQAKFAMSESGVKAGELTHRTIDASGALNFREMVQYPLESVYAFRIALRDRTAYVMIQETSTSQPILLGRVNVESNVLAIGDLRAIVHTAGEGRKTVALFKRLTVHAAEIKE